MAQPGFVWIALCKHGVDNIVHAVHILDVQAEMSVGSTTLVQIGERWNPVREFVAIEFIN